MGDQQDKKKVLPPFRPELKLFRGPDEPTGAPTFNLFDPIKSQYYKINWTQSLVFQFFRPGMTIEEVTNEINSNTTVKVTAEEVTAFFNWAHHFGLLRVLKESDKLMEEVEKGRVNPFKWLIFHYLFFRIPLINPDKFLSSTLHYVTFLGSTIAFAVYGIVTLSAILLLLPQFDLFIATFPYFFTLEGALFFGLGIIAVKIIHEFAHAYTAKHYGIYVPTMGVAFLILWPVLYTDVTHGWQLRNRTHRLAISAAGVMSELILAGFATIGWLLTSPGILNSILFVIASSSWITSLFVNLNPALKFDGYYLLQDTWGIDNMQPRSFAMARWKFRQVLLGLNAPPPEENLSERTIFWMCVYSLYTWIYRIFLYTAIALLVYYKFTKALGVFLFLTEILVFFIWPLISEIKALKELRKYFTTNPRLLLTATSITLLLLWIVVPLPHTQTFPATIAAVEQQTLYAPVSGKIEDLSVARGDLVEPGQLLFKIRSYPLENALENQKVESKILQTQVNILSQKDEGRRFVGQKRAELAQSEERAKTLETQKREMEIYAEVSGKIVDWDQTLKPNQYVRQNQEFGLIVDDSQIKVVFYVAERYWTYLYQGQSITFTLPGPYQVFEGVVTKIGQARVENLEYPQLASQNYGDLPTIEGEGGAFRVVDSYYPVEAIFERPDLGKEKILKYGNMGDVTIVGPWRSLLVEFLRTVQGVLYRESGT